MNKIDKGITEDEYFTLCANIIFYINSKNKYESNVRYLEAFREKYRNIDVLMIDDIQFLENKTKSQIC